MQSAGGARVEFKNGFSSFLFWLLLVPIMRLLLHIVVFWEPSKRQCLDVNL